MQTISLKDLSNIIFNLIPEDIQKKYEKTVLGETLTLKDQFISYCESVWKYPKYSKEKTEEKVKEILRNPSFDKNGKFNFSMFNEIMGDYFTKSKN